MQSIADGYMGRCEMVWTTAGTNRVCGRCMELKDTVVGTTDQSGVTIPPLHPRCRCAIMYREVGTPRRSSRLPSINSKNPVGFLTPERIKEIKDAEDAAYNAVTGADFGFKKMNQIPFWTNELRRANGDGKGIERKINCQRCVIAHEARMRGYNVIARPGWGIEDPLQIVGNWLKVFDDEHEIYNCKGSKPDEIKSFIEIKMKEWGVGARAFIWFQWEQSETALGTGHVILAWLNENRFVNFGDPQTGKIGADRNLNRAKLNSTVIMRVDNLKFTDIVKRCCVNRE